MRREIVYGRIGKVMTMPIVKHLKRLEIEVTREKKGEGVMKIDLTESLPES